MQFLATLKVSPLPLRLFNCWPSCIIILTLIFTIPFKSSCFALLLIVWLPLVLNLQVVNLLGFVRKNVALSHAFFSLKSSNDKSTLIFLFSTSCLPFPISVPHFGRNLKETCKLSPQVEQNSSVRHWEPLLFNHE